MSRGAVGMAGEWLSWADGVASWEGCRSATLYTPPDLQRAGPVASRPQKQPSVVLCQSLAPDTGPMGSCRPRWGKRSKRSPFPRVPLPNAADSNSFYDRCGEDRRRIRGWILEGNSLPHDTRGGGWGRAPRDVGKGQRVFRRRRACGRVVHHHTLPLEWPTPSIHPPARPPTRGTVRLAQVAASRRVHTTQK